MSDPGLISVLGVSGALVSPVLTVPACAVVMLLIAGYLLALRAASEMPASRRRVRLASAGVLLVLTPMMTAALSLVSPGEHERFVLCWGAVLGLLVIVVLLACVDLLNTLRLALREHRALHRRALGDVARTDPRPSSTPGQE